MTITTTRMHLLCYNSVTDITEIAAGGKRERNKKDKMKFKTKIIHL